MANELFNKDNTELDGNDESISVTTSSTLDGDETLLHYYNSTNVSVSVTISGSRGGDDTFAEGVELNTESLSSGGTAGYFVVDEPWDKVEVLLSPGSNPSSGSISVHKMVGN